MLYSGSITNSVLLSVYIVEAETGMLACLFGIQPFEYPSGFFIKLNWAPLLVQPKMDTKTRNVLGSGGGHCDVYHVTNEMPIVL